MRSKRSIKKSMNHKHHFGETIGDEKKDYQFKNKSYSKTNNGVLKQNIRIIEFNDTELNDLNYDLARKFDKRTYCQYYFSLLKTKHPLFFTFFNNNDYNSKIIKIDLFIFNLILFYVINTIFFNDDSMHKIYKNKGAFDLIDQLPQIIYSSLISSLFSFILEMLALTEGVILQLKKIKTPKKFYRVVGNVNNRIKIKFLIYFIMSTIFLLLFWYYISMFCAIYINTQIHLIKDTVLSFILSLIEPLGIYLIPGIFRIPALSKKNNNMYKLYKFSVILQNIIIL